jgi:hypothetical protein
MVHHRRHYRRPFVSTPAGCPRRAQFNRHRRQQTSVSAGCSTAFWVSEKGFQLDGGRPTGGVTTSVAEGAGAGVWGCD